MKPVSKIRQCATAFSSQTEMGFGEPQRYAPVVEGLPTHARLDTVSCAREIGGADHRGEPPRSQPTLRTGRSGHRERMRERLLHRGPDGFADYELLEMLLYFAVPRRETKMLAKALINRHGSFANVLTTPHQVLLGTGGLCEQGASALKLVQAAAIRLAQGEVLGQPIFSTWDRLIEYLTAAMARERTEVFRVLFLDSKNRLIADEAQARGTVNHTPVYPREVVKRALDLHATAIILVHNHPSGDPSPSRSDIEMTRQVREAASVLAVTLHDHLIIGNGRWLSFRAEGLL